MCGAFTSSNSGGASLFFQPGQSIVAVNLLNVFPAKLLSNPCILTTTLMELAS
jgi:hypothetical protein